MSQSHWSGPLFADDRAHGGDLYRNLPVEVLAARSHMRYFNDFLDSNDEADWVVTTITSGTADIIADLPLGVYRVNASTANQGLGSIQLTNADNASEGLATPAAGRTIVMVMRAAINDIDNCDWFFGLGEIDTTFMDAAGALLANGADNHVGFHHLVADAGIPDMSMCGTALANIQASITPKSNAAINSALANSTYYEFGIRIEGVSSAQFFLDGVAQTEKTAFTVDLADGLVPTICMIANGANINMDIDYVDVICTR